MIKLRVGRYYRFRDGENDRDRHVRVLYVGKNWNPVYGCKGPENIAVTAVFFGELCAQVLEHDADTGLFREGQFAAMDLVEDVTAKIKALIKREAEAKKAWGSEAA